MRLASGTPGVEASSSLCPQSTNPVIRNWNWLYTASLQRFWLDHMANWLLVNPIKRLSRDVRNFEDKVVTRIVGLPAQASPPGQFPSNPQAHAFEGRGGGAEHAVVNRNHVGC